ncbi:MAG: ankyrin repeat domain-containing protein [Gemmatimonadetes bacterium]|nr:ankyrin repeat domain-containing protein [Gemmatimonadota bacterium]
MADRHPVEPGPGATPLHLAALAGNRVAVESLLQARAEPNARDDLGAKPLHYAARAGARGVVEVLLSRGANVRAATDGGVAAIHEAARHGHRSVVEALLAAGAPAAVADFQGNTPLSLARTGRHDAVAALLMSVLPAWAVLPIVDTLTLDPERAEFSDWVTQDVTPQARDGGDWWVAIANLHYGEDDAPPCSYRRPWSGRPWNSLESDGGMWIERWRFRRAAASRLERIEIAAETHQASECTAQGEIERRFATALRGLPGRLSQDAVWVLEAADTFRLPVTPARRLSYRAERDTTAELPLEGDLVRGQRTLLCFSGDPFPDERCVMVNTAHGDAYANWVWPVSAAVHNDTLWIFGLWTRGELVQPVWAVQPHATTPVLLGRLPLPRARP